MYFHSNTKFISIDVNLCILETLCLFYNSHWISLSLWWRISGAFICNSLIFTNFTTKCTQSKKATGRLAGGGERTYPIYLLQFEAKQNKLKCNKKSSFNLLYVFICYSSHRHLLRR